VSVNSAYFDSEGMGSWDASCRLCALKNTKMEQKGHESEEEARGSRKRQERDNVRDKK